MPRLAGWREPARSTDTGMLASGQLTSPGVPMSTPTTGAIQRARLLAAGLRVTDLPQLRDVDTAADAVAVARQAPQSRFAAQARELATVLSRAGSVTGESVLGETA